VRWWSLTNDETTGDAPGEGRAPTLTTAQPGTLRTIDRIVDRSNDRRLAAMAAWDRRGGIHDQVDAMSQR
jgi:hypothetical protein